MTGALRLLGVAALLCTGAAPIGAQVTIRNPSLPARESIVYAERAGATVRSLTQTLSRHEGADGRWLELRSRSEESESYVRMDEASLFPSYSEVTQRGSDAVIRRTTEVLQASPQPKPDELVISDFASLPFLLRGLPWETFTTARIVALGTAARDSSFSLQLTLAGRETVTIGASRYDCYKVQVGLNGFWGAFVGRSTYWYLAASPHYLVRSEAPSGGPGSPTVIVELQSYAAR